MLKVHTTNVCTGHWLATADEAGWLNIFALESLATRPTATSDHATARQRPSSTGGINALAFARNQRSGAHQLVCDTGRVCCVFNVNPRIATPKQSLGELHLHLMIVIISANISDSRVAVQ